MIECLEKLHHAGFSAYLYGFSAIDSWLDRNVLKNNQAGIFILTNAGIAHLAKLYENLRYPGAAVADAAMDYKNLKLFFCNDDEGDGGASSVLKNNHLSFKLLEFYRDCKSRVFYDPRGIYPLLAEIRRGLIRCPQAAGKKDIRSPQKSGKNIEGRLQQSPFEILHEGLNPRVERGKAVTDAALILSKYFSQGAEAERQIKK